MTISDWLSAATKQLTDADISSARLDAEIILAHTIKKNRTYLHAHSTDSLQPRTEEIANARLDLRLDRTPIAYIIGHKEFYGRMFHVSSSVLVPRPESEATIDTLRELLPDSHALPGHTKRLVDVGTGSGCLGITAKLEFPELDVTLLDIDRHALTVAEKNATSLHADVQILKSNLLGSYPFQAEIIIANLPYVDQSWERSPETNHEPSLALFAKQGGLQLIYQLIDQAQSALLPNGHLILEADPMQHATIIYYAKQRELSHCHTFDYCVAFRKG